MTEWRASPVVALSALVLFLVVQLALPISRMGDHDRAQRFGWQMFSTVGRPIEFVVHTEQGSKPVDLNDVFARVRADLPLADLVPPHLCEIRPDAVRITWDEESFSC